MLGFKSFLMSYRKILVTHSTEVNPAQNQVEELCRAAFGGREWENLLAMLQTLSPPAPCTNNHAEFAFLFACRHIACLMVLVAQLSCDSDPVFLPHSLLLGRTLMAIIALWYTGGAGEAPSVSHCLSDIIITDSLEDLFVFVKITVYLSS